MELSHLFQAVFLNVHQVLTLFALAGGSFAIGVFLYQLGVEERRHAHRHGLDDFSILDE